MTKALFTLLAVAAGALTAANTVAAGVVTKRVAIVHVQKGCHVWSVGALKTASLTLSLHRGDRLTVLNQDLDMHKLVQVSGPSTKAGPFMMMNQRVSIRFERVSIRFAKAGLYRFHTRVADMRGMP